jgi:S-DNA-T family DNA segregation ATPase FtsK/SpoIIIE
MNTNDRLEKIEKQIDLLILKTDIIYSKITDDESFGAMGTELGSEDELYNDAKEIVVESGKASASLLQRRLRVGYARAARLLDILEENGIIGPAESVRPRDVLVDEKFAPGLLLPLDLLEVASEQSDAGDVSKNVEIIQNTLQKFGIEITMGEINIGPTLTQYTLKLVDSSKLSKIKTLENDLSLALKSSAIRIEAPIPSIYNVGIEVPNKVVATITLREVLESEEFKNSKSNLTLATGRDVAGIPIVVDLKQTPHLLMSGATGSGKSVLINAMILSLLYRNSPKNLSLILIDPKRVEFAHYNGIPHLLSPIIYDVDKAVSALRWALAEMDRRFYLLQENASRNIEVYNENHPNEKLPHIVIFIDELSDLMAQVTNEVEAAVVRLAKMSRAVGIHMVMATSRPSVDVITGLIKANIPSRIGLTTASDIDSQTIIDTVGAEKLLGKGDILFRSDENGNLKRIQAPLVTDEEINKITDFLKAEGIPFVNKIEIDPFKQDELYDDAKKVVIKEGRASSALLQRHLKIGYARACRLLDILESEGVIGPADGAKPRDILEDR